ncbi:helix-turn-helix domain-containing protein [Butyrivibrio sp. NC2007]|uniref:helix-turn-helix domain-containing protein n=1 Tax=Butyrivibrio sp. NC2007 TaxID=1280683 RepID=UPI0003B44C2F|nr:helix-turn-helix transcriptional regulator [Butyrivibrio sp. NC2007]
MDFDLGAAVGARLKELRESRGLSQKDVSNEFVITGRSTLANYELGIRDVPIKILVLYSTKFNVSTDWILKGETSSGNSEIDELVRAYSSINNEVVKKAVIRQIEGLENF